MELTEIMFSLIRTEICGIQQDEQLKNSITPDLFHELFTLSSHHDIAHIVAQALSKANSLNDNDISKKFNKAILMAVYRYERSQHEFKKICKALSDAGIDFIPLKGAVISNYYTQPWLRTSCDIDILVNESDLEKAISALMSECQYSVEEKKNYHDISLYSKNGVHLELHFSIKEGIESLDNVLSTIWQHVTPSQEMPHKYELTNEFLLFHVVAHMSYHFVFGGCGIRPLIDLFILERGMTINQETFHWLLSESKLTKFYNSIKLLCSVWFDSEKHTDITKQMENFILLGGAYGSLKNKVAIQQQKRNGKYEYFYRRIFLNRSKLTQLYPIIQKHPCLAPFMQVHRWFKLLFGGRARRALHELSYNNNVTKAEYDATKHLLNEIGL